MWLYLYSCFSHTSTIPPHPPTLTLSSTSHPWRPSRKSSNVDPCNTYPVIIRCRWITHMHRYIPAHRGDYFIALICNPDINPSLTAISTLTLCLLWHEPRRLINCSLLQSQPSCYLYCNRNLHPMSTLTQTASWLYHCSCHYHTFLSSDFWICIPFQSL